MSILRRYYKKNNVYFITNVTYKRRSILIENNDILWSSFNEIKERIPFEIIAYIIMPDHFHLILDTYKNDFSRIMQRIKMSFSSKYRKRFKMLSGRVWQHRFWDHMIRDEKDYNHHIDYIHYNPVKHGYVNNPLDWENSSIHEFYKKGYYQSDWGTQEKIKFEGEYGE